MPPTQIFPPVECCVQLYILNINYCAGSSTVSLRPFVVFPKM